MSSIQKFLWIFLGTLICLSCNQSREENHTDTTNDSLILNIQVNPAFYEYSETTLFKSDSLNYIQILLRNYIGADRTQDTFLFKKIYLSDRQFEALDSSLIIMCRQKVSYKTSRLKGVDGMSISSNLITKGDTNFISFWSPIYEEDSVGYFFSSTIFRILPSIFKDSIVTEYFNEMEEYIDPSKTHHTDPIRKIDQLRMKKYNWTIRGQGSK